MCQKYGSRVMAQGRLHHFTWMHLRTVDGAAEQCFAFQQTVLVIQVADGLAHSISALDENISTVIGIEGQWGAGKTSLLNLLIEKLKIHMPEKTQVLTFSPWLMSPDESPVAALLLTVAARLAELDPSYKAAAGQVSPLVRNVLNYAQQTSRRMAPLTELAGDFLPGFGLVAKGMKALAETDLSLRSRTTSEIRQEIEQKIAETGTNFIVIIDDLDRLEPAQAVEVLRMVRSVADFSRFRYVMCYDRDVLAHAVQHGLSVRDGQLYLQKIIPLSFSLPRPESFDLRREFISGAIRLYESVNHAEPDETLKNDLYRLTDLYGTSLQTPREVQLALNGLVFRYGGLRDYVYLPDLCFLQLIRTTNPGLYDWAEEYLTERAVVESGDGTVSEEERHDLARTLYDCLSRFRSSEAKSATSLGHWIPGITGNKVDNLSLFGRIPEEDKATMTASRRLGSTAYWRYYFAFSSPQNVLSPAYFDELFRKSGTPEQRPELAQELLKQITSKGVSSQTWFEHIISQMTWPMIAGRTPAQCAGLLEFFCEHGDQVISSYVARNRFFSTWDIDINSVADRLLKRMCEDDHDGARRELSRMLQTGKSWRWIADYFRHLLWMHGLAGDRAVSEDERLFTRDEMEALRTLLATRLNGTDIMSQIQPGYPLQSYIWAWRDICGLETVKSWFRNEMQNDESFLNLLLSLRYNGISSATGYYQALGLAQLREFLGEEQMLLSRLEHIEAKGSYQELTVQIRRLLKRNNF